ncbi:alpha/beta hydrolase [Halorussus sp. AFM4]|uniref:alpha/beta hydrolase n=1 Tax=Halorussus sp. AFM4 TaxID=3421651 RepID=UPI003EBD4E7C
MAGRNPHAGHDDPHAGQEVVTAGPDLDDADAAVVFVHGRGATAQSILQMAGEFDAEGVAYLAPQARGRTWYPNSFMAPIEDNEPSLSSALNWLGDLRERIEEAGVPAEKTMFVGFSQGACLSSEFVARNARKYGGLAALSGGVIGPDGTPRDYDGSLDGTPVFLGCSDSDPHIPLERVHETRDVFEDLDGDVEERIYEGMGHGVNRDETEYVTEMVESLTADD